MAVDMHGISNRQWSNRRIDIQEIGSMKYEIKAESDKELFSYTADQCYVKGSTNKFTLPLQRAQAKGEWEVKQGIKFSHKRFIKEEFMPEFGQKALYKTIDLNLSSEEKQEAELTIKFVNKKSYEIEEETCTKVVYGAT